jgi:putative membrane protein
MQHLKPFKFTQLAIALSLAIPLCVGAQTKSNTPAVDPAQRPATSAAGSALDGPNLSSADRKFMNEAAMGGMLEVELGQIAVQNASSDQVRQFGQRMVDDHGKANNELMSLAQQEGATLPNQLDSKHRKEVQRLQKLKGAEFDREYMKMMVEDHHHDVSAFQREADKGQDADVKGFASKTLPTLKEHQALAEQTNSMVTGDRKQRDDTTTGTTGSDRNNNR